MGIKLRLSAEQFNALQKGYTISVIASYFGANIKIEIEHPAGGPPAELASERAQCTGVAAVWCPVHGECSCKDRQDQNDESCPLHGSSSNHAEDL